MKSHRKGINGAEESVEARVEKFIEEVCHLDTLVHIPESPRDGSGKVIADVTPLSTQIAKVAKVALDIFAATGLIGAKKKGDCKVIECLSDV